MTDTKSVWEQFHDLEAPIYDTLCFTQNTQAEVDFLVAELGLAPGAAILDVACGTGRHSVELARRGYAVTGFDFSAGMLAQARAKAQAAGVQVEFVQANAAQFAPTRSYDAAINLCEGAFGLLGSGDDPVEQPLAILRNIARSLRPGGRALLTVLNGLRMARAATPADAEAGRFDPLTMTTVTDLAPVEGAPVMRLRERAFFATEVPLLFGTAGLRPLHIWGGTAGSWDKGPIGLDEMEMMIVAERPQA